MLRPPPQEMLHLFGVAHAGEGQPLVAGSGLDESDPTSCMGCSECAGSGAAFVCPNAPQVGLRVPRLLMIGRRQLGGSCPGVAFEQWSLVTDGRQARHCEAKCLEPLSLIKCVHITRKLLSGLSCVVLWMVRGDGCWRSWGACVMQEAAACLLRVAPRVMSCCRRRCYLPPSYFADWTKRRNNNIRVCSPCRCITSAGVRQYLAATWTAVHCWLDSQGNLRWGSNVRPDI